MFFFVEYPLFVVLCILPAQLCCVVFYCVVFGCVVLCWVVLCCIVLYCVVLCCVVFCCVVLSCVVLYCAVLCYYVLCAVITTHRHNWVDIDEPSRRSFGFVGPSNDWPNLQLRLSDKVNDLLCIAFSWKRKKKQLKKFSAMLRSKSSAPYPD